MFGDEITKKEQKITPIVVVCICFIAFLLALLYNYAIEEPRPYYNKAFKVADYIGKSSW